MATAETIGRTDGAGGTTPYLVLLALAGFDAAGYSVIAPVTPAIADATGAGPTLIGLLVASFPVGMLVGFAVSAIGVRRHRNRPVLVAALGIIAIGCVGFMIGDGLGALLTARVLMGLGSGGIWIVVTFETLERWPGQEYLCMSRIFAAYAAGGFAGPLIGGLGGIDAPFASYLVLALVALALVGALSPPTVRRSFATDRSALRLPGFWVASAGIAFVVLGQGVAEGVLPLHFSSELGQHTIGLALALTAILVTASAALAARVPPGTAVAGSVALVVAALLLAGGVDTPPLWLLALAMLGVGLGLGNTGSVGVLLESVETDRIVTAMIVWSQIGILGYLVGPALGGVVAERAGYGFVVVVPLLAGSLVAAAAWRRRRRA